MAIITRSRPTLTCDRVDLVSTFPCLNCLDKDNLIRVLAWILVVYEDLDPEDDLDEILGDFECYNCMDDHQKLVGLVSIFAESLLESDLDIPAILESRRFAHITMDQAKKIILGMLCRMFLSQSE